eukprot:863256-Rhodomonas_salina.1
MFYKLWNVLSTRARGYQDPGRNSYQFCTAGHHDTGSYPGIRTLDPWRYIGTRVSGTLQLQLDQCQTTSRRRLLVDLEFRSPSLACAPCIGHVSCGRRISLLL